MGNIFRESEWKKSIRLSKRRWEKENNKVGLKEARPDLSDLSVSDQGQYPVLVTLSELQNQ